MDHFKVADLDLAQAFRYARGKPSGTERDFALLDIALTLITVDARTARSAAGEIQDSTTRMECWFRISMLTSEDADVQRAFGEIQASVTQNPEEQADLRLALETQWACRDQDWPKARIACQQIRHEGLRYEILVELARESGDPYVQRQADAIEPVEEEDESAEISNFEMLIYMIAARWSWWIEETSEAWYKSRLEELVRQFRPQAKTPHLLIFLSFCELAKSGQTAASTVVISTMLERNTIGFQLTPEQGRAYLCAIAAGFALDGDEAEARKILRQVPTTTTDYRHLAHARLYRLKLMQQAS